MKKSPDAWDRIKQIVCKELNLPNDSPEPPRKNSAPAFVSESQGASETRPFAGQAEPLVPDDDVRSRCDALLGRATPTPMLLEALTAQGPRRTKVLCIDDDPDISDILRIRLGPYNVEVLRALSGIQGFWTALGERPDAIICDMCMSEGDGNYTVSRLKSHPLTKDVPVIVLTGQKSPIVRRIMLRQGVEAYLPKPLVFEELLRRLREVLKLPPDAVRREHQRVSTP